MYRHDGLPDGVTVHLIPFVKNNSRELMAEQGRRRHEVMAPPVCLEIGPAGQGGFHPHDHVGRSRDRQIDIVACFDPSRFNQHTCAHREMYP